MVIATELLKGQGLGNQLFCYIAIRCLAERSHCGFSILNREIFANNIHSSKGMYFMDLDCGLAMEKDDFEIVYQEHEDRLYIGNSMHDLEHGCYITGADEKLLDLQAMLDPAQGGSVLIYGNLQAEEYFGNYKKEIKEWLRVKPEYDCMDYAKENLCVINIRGGEYASSPELFLRRKYWLDAMRAMKKIRGDMEFMAVTDDLAAAKRILPEVEAYHFDLAGDYTVIKNARYLIVSNSTFAFFPAFTSDTVQTIIAPKYWARHNVSDGYWASEQNIYSDFLYMDRKGKLFTAEECRNELAYYKAHSGKYKRVGRKLSGMQLKIAKLCAKWLVYKDLSVRMLRSVRRRLRRC